MTIQELAEWRPYLYHIMRQQDQEMVRANGLRSATALINNGAVNGSVSWRWVNAVAWQQATPHDLVRQLRTESIEVQFNPQPVVLRDQHPLGGPNGLIALQQVLNDGLTPEDWLNVLNARVFLFPCRGPNDPTMCAKGEIFRNANGPDLSVLAIKTCRIPKGLADKIELAKINGGAVNGMAGRGNDTYTPLSLFLVTEQNEIQEITIRNGATVDELLACSVSPWFNDNRQGAA